MDKNNHLLKFIEKIEKDNLIEDDAVLCVWAAERPCTSDYLSNNCHGNNCAPGCGQGPKNLICP